MILARLLFVLLALSLLLSSGCNRTSTSASTEIEHDQVAPVVPAPLKQAIVDSSFDDIKFEMEKTDPFERSLLTPKIEELLGRRIRIRGFMFPTLKKRGLKQFVLVRDNLECCFGPGAAIFDCILVHMNEGQTAEYSIRPIAVEGTFGLEEIVGPDGNHLAIYRLDGESVE
ncbi:MAG: DUF3299 domain-containing protein [Planctomycetes bacterium]|nr:DUF3299 domain-containing protein [Planctomycetota bacterium]